jgi:hypothetical protein
LSERDKIRENVIGGGGDRGGKGGGEGRIMKGGWGGQEEEERREMERKIGSLQVKLSKRDLATHHGERDIKRRGRGGGGRGSNAIMIECDREGRESTISDG